MAKKLKNTGTLWQVTAFSICHGHAVTAFRTKIAEFLDPSFYMPKIYLVTPICTLGPLNTSVRPAIPFASSTLVQEEHDNMVSGHAMLTNAVWIVRQLNLI